MCGATNLRIVGPTAVVTTFAVAISSTTASASVALLIARKPGHDGVDTAFADLVDGVGGDAVDRVDERGRDIREHEVIAALVQEQPDEPAADVAGAEVDGLHDSLTALRIA